jgi:hypothetical protein
MGHKRTYHPGVQDTGCAGHHQRSAQRCRRFRQHNLKPQLVGRWRTEFLERAVTLFAGDRQQLADQTRIAELERLVGRSHPPPDAGWGHSLARSGAFAGIPEQTAVCATA